MEPPRLPRRLSAYIRTLKESGELEKAYAVRQVAVEEKQERRILGAMDQLRDTVIEIIESKDGDVVYNLTKQVKAIWILDRMDIINGAERYDELKTVVGSQSPEIQDALEARFPSVREEINRLFPTRKI